MVFNTRRSGSSVLLTAVASVVVLSLAGCSTSGSASSATAGATSASSSKGGTIAFVPKQTGNPYYHTSDTAGQKAVEALGYTFQNVAPSAATADGQVSFINTLTQKKVAAIALAASDPSAVCSATKAAMAAGIAVVTYDSDANADCRKVFVRPQSAQDIGAGTVKMLVDQIGDSGTIAIMTTTPNAQTNNDEIEGIKAYLAANAPKIKIVETVYGEDNDQISFDKTQGLLAAHPDLTGIVGVTGTGIAASMRYMSGSSFKGKVAVTGLCQPSECKTYIQDGTVTAFGLWNPADLGTIAAYAADALINGKITGAKGDTFPAEGVSTGVKSFTVGENGIVDAGPLTVFTADNVDKFDF